MSPNNPRECSSGWHLVEDIFSLFSSSFLKQNEQRARWTDRYFFISVDSPPMDSREGAQGPGMWYSGYTDQGLGSSALCHQELWVKYKLPKSMMGETQNGHSAPHWGPPSCPTEINHIFCSAGDCNQDFVLVRHILSD